MSATLQVIGSSSAANGYILSAGNEKLIIEAGCKYKEYLHGLDYDTKNTYCIVSHCHSDHCRNLDRILSYGIPAYGPQSVCDTYTKCKCVEHLHKYKVGGFTIMPLSTEHNVECMSYIIEHPDCGRIAFITDSRIWPYTVPNVKHWLVESNYDENIIVDALCNGSDVRSQSQWHMSIDETIKTLRRNNAQSADNIILIHLSDALSNESDFKERIFNEIGKRPLIATSGLTVNLNEDDF